MQHSPIVKNSLASQLDKKNPLITGTGFYMILNTDDTNRTNDGTSRADQQIFLQILFIEPNYVGSKQTS